MVHQIQQLEVVVPELRFHLPHHIVGILTNYFHHKCFRQNATQLLHMSLVVEQGTFLICTILVAELFPAHRIPCRNETCFMQNETHSEGNLHSSVNHHLIH